MITVKDVKRIVDSRLENTGYEQVGTIYNDKRKTFRRFKILVKKLNSGEMQKYDLMNVEIALEGETNFRRYHSGFYQYSHGNAIMCFVWYVDLD